jgi:hypothetical protein
MGAVQISGSLVATDSCSSTCSGVGGNQAVFVLGDAVCGVCTKHYQSVVNSVQPLQVLTTGLPGAQFVDLDILDGFVGIELLAVHTDQKLFLRIGADVARVLGVGGTFPTGFGGGETAIVDYDGLGSVTTTFTAAAQTAAQVAAEMNAAAALAGLATPRVTVAISGELQIESIQTGAQGSVEVVGGTGLATLGLTAGTTLGAGADVPIQGDGLFEFPRDTDSPARIQVSGQGTITLLAGGRTS